MKEISKDIFNIFFANSIDMLCVIDMEYRFVKVNPEWEKTLGYSAAETEGKLITDFIHPDDIENTIKAIKQIPGNQISKDFINRNLHKNGTYRWIEWRSFFLDGLIYSSARDITEKKIAEKELDFTKAILSTAFEQTPIPLLIVSAPDNIIRMSNKACIDFLGIKESDYIGKSFYDLQRTWQVFDEHGSPIPVTELPIPLALKGVEIKNKEHFIKRHDGAILWQLINSSTVRNSKGEIIAAYLIFLDITERKRIEKLIASERNTLRALIDNIADFVYVKDVECRYIITNRALVNITEKSVESYIGKTDLDIYPDEISSEFISDDRKLLKTGIPIINKEEKLFDTNGNIIIFLTTKLPTYDSNGIINGLVGTGHIITERKRAEEKIKTLNVELERKVEERTLKLNEVNRDLEAFAHTVSHDLRAPIRHIDGFVKLMYSNIPDPNDLVTGYYSKIEIAAKRMSSMIDSLLLFSRLGRKELSLSWINLELLLKEIIEEFRPDMEDRRIKWNFSILPPLKCDKDFMKLAFENIIANAIKYTSKKKHAIITIGCKAVTDELIEVFIKDNGIGFDMAYADKLFGVFQRLHTSNEFEGVGIGLANARRIIEKHRGSIRAEGKINKGATFYITLPTV